MFRTKSAGVILAAALAAVTLPALSQTVAELPDNVPDLRKEANRAYFTKDYRAFRNAMIRLHDLRPNNSEYMYQLVLAHALLDEKNSAYDMMLQMQRQGLAYDFDKTEDSLNIRGTPIYSYLNDLMVMAGQPMGEASEVATLGKDVGLPEAITWDEGRNAFLVGTIEDGAVLAVDGDGKISELLRASEDNGMWGVFGLLVDAGRNRLWVSTSATTGFSGFDAVDKGRSALLEFELESLELVKHYPVPVDGRPHVLANMAMAPNGDLYVADSRLPLVYVKKAGEERLKPYFGTRDMVSLRGIAISDDGRNLYVADYEMGIARIDLQEGNPTLLRIPETLNLGGIDGLNFWNGNLIIIQNGISPQRLMRLTLDAEGGSVTAVAPMAVALEVFDFPNYGTVVGEEMVYFANSHWGSKPENRKPVKIVSTGLTGAENLVPLDMQKFMEERARRGLEMPSLLPMIEPDQEEDPDG